MLTLLKNLWTSLDAEKQKKSLQEKFEEEQLYLDNEIDREEKITDKVPESSMHNILQGSTFQTNESDSKEMDACYKRKGIITSLKSNHGTIDHTIFFDMKVALLVSNELKVGSNVEYLAYKKEGSDHVKVVKMLQVVDHYWDEELPTEKKIEYKIEELKKEKPKFFNTHQRNILGLIVERKPDSILIDTDYKMMNVNLDSVEIDFVPKEGDRVYVCCNVQSDENFVDKQGEILQEVSVHPARILKQEKCTVRKINSDWGVLNKNCYFTFDILPAACKLNMGDVVIGDLIECERGDYIWRCIKLTLMEPANDTTEPSSTPSVQRSENHAVSVTDNMHCIFASTLEKQEVQVTITNNIDRKIVLQNIEIPHRRRDSVLQLIDPNPMEPITINSGDSHTIRFEAESKSYGETRECFKLHFGTFKVTRNIYIHVYEDEKSAEAARLNINNRGDIACLNPASFTQHNAQHRSRYYANQVWSNKCEVIPGVFFGAKRRFIAQRIGGFEVPERLRTVYLTSERYTDIIDNIEGMFSCLKEELSMENYTPRFQTLLHLEEIECFINFRNYDRERAHFSREGEFLSLVIDNLAERRPSLVIGDSVRAINPWSESTSDARCYDGVIHKVLFNRILLKFNPGFQSKYNGEDYRLQFYFSRFRFRKQHFAVNRIVKHLGETFLFPSKIHLRENVQLDVDLDEDHNLILNNESCQWFNTSLNVVQKRAIHNILRGEAQNMPYVVFGPPGTGKTITLVETILQLVKNLPSARLLVGTPSNSSADLIATRIIESGVLQPGDFVRLVSQNLIEKELIPDHLTQYCATVDIAADGSCSDSMIVTESGLKLKCQMKYLGRHRVTISTCSTLGNFLQMGFPPGHFTHVLIDESGQCTEPEIVVAISQVSQSRGQVVLTGDPYQLQAVVINSYAARNGLALSLLERILQRSPYTKDMVRFPNTQGFDPRLVTKLIYNYRALPSILNVYNELFYDSELLAEVNEFDSREAKMLLKLDEILPTSKTRPKSHGAFFYGVRSENMQEKDSPSWYNPIEAKNVFLMTIKLYQRDIQPESIGIISPYLKQVKHLRTLFIAADIAMPKIGSVEEFQGQERDIILISTVRSSEKYIANDLRYSLGFVRCPKRMNVAISRPRYLMFVFGNPHLLALDICWRTYINYCLDNDAYLGCDLPDNMKSLPKEDSEDEKNSITN